MALGVLASAVACASTAEIPANPEVYARAIGVLGGRVVNAWSYPDTAAGFQSYLSDTGISAVSAAEMTRPNHPGIAARLGFRDFLPPQKWWSRGAALALLTQAVDKRIGDVAHLRNWWRPAAYNADPVVAGAKNGDHPTACAIDLDYRLVSQRMRAESFLRELDKRYAWMQLSLGLGALTTHIGMGSPRGHREWHYAGWRPTDRASNS